MVPISVKRAILASLTFGLASFPFSAYAMPQGAHDAQNIDKIAQAAKVMDVEGHGNAVIKWRDFSVDADETVNFKGMSKMLNYVDQKNPSKISGAINAKGVDLYVINPSGVLFNDSSKVNVANLFVSSRAMTDAALNKFAKDGVNPLDTPVMAADIGKGGRKSEEILGAYDIADGDIALLGKVTANSMTIEGNVVQLKNTQDYTDGDGNLLKGDAVKLVSDNPVEVGYEVEDPTDGSNKYIVALNNKDSNGSSASMLGYVVANTDCTTGNLQNSRLVFSADDLVLLNAADKRLVNGSYMLAQDINFQNKTVQSIGKQPDYTSNDYVDENNMQFVFNGLNHKIKNANFGDGALFSNIFPKATVKNLRFENVEGKNLLANSGQGIVKNVNFISGQAKNGALAHHWNESSRCNGAWYRDVPSSVTNVENHANIVNDESNNTGGLIGYVYGSAPLGSFHNNVNYGKVSSLHNSNCTGGLIGEYDFSDQIKKHQLYKLANLGEVSSKDGIQTGGLFGWLDYSDSKSSISISQSFNTGRIFTEDGMAGGLIGEIENSGVNNWQLNEVFNFGDIEASGFPNSKGVGGIIGDIHSGSPIQITNAYNAGNIRTAMNDFITGGIIGQSNSPLSFENIYNTGDIDGDYIIGGIIGMQANYSPFSMKNVFNTGDIHATAHDAYAYALNGGIAGFVYVKSIVAENVSSSGSVTTTFTTSTPYGKTHSLFGYFSVSGDKSFLNVTWAKQQGATGIEASSISGISDEYDKLVYRNDAVQAQDATSMNMATVYNFFDIDKNGSNPDATWRIYEGHGLPLLTFAMRPATVQATTSRLYNGHTQVVPLSSIITLGDAKDRNRVLDSAHVFGYDLSGRNAGVYSQPMWSDQFGYNFQFDNPLGNAANTAYLHIYGVPKEHHEILDYGLNRGHYTGISNERYELLPQKTESVTQVADVENRQDNLVVSNG